MSAFIVYVSVLFTALAVHVPNFDDHMSMKVSKSKSVTTLQGFRDYDSMWGSVDSLVSAVRGSQRNNSSSTVKAAIVGRRDAKATPATSGSSIKSAQTLKMQTSNGNETARFLHTGIWRRNSSAKNRLISRIGSNSLDARTISVPDGAAVNRVRTLKVRRSLENATAMELHLQGEKKSTASAVNQSVPRMSPSSWNATAASVFDSATVKTARSSKLGSYSGNDLASVLHAEGKKNKAFARSRLAPQTGRRPSNTTAVSVPDRTPATASWTMKISSSFANDVAKVLHAGSNESNASVKSRLAPQTARGVSGAKAASVLDSHSVNGAWTLRLKSPSGNATAKVLHAEGNTSAKSQFAPQTGRRWVSSTANATRQMLRPKNVTNAMGDVAVGIHGRNSTVGSLFGSMAAAIKESAVELKAEQAEAKHEQVEAKRELAQANREQAEAQREQKEAKREQEEAKHDQLEAKRELAKAKRTADAAFAAGAISSSRGVSHSKLRPRRQRHSDNVSEPAPAGSPPRAPSGHPETMFDLAIRDAKSGVGALSTRHRGRRSSAHEDVMWKMVGDNEWLPRSGEGEVSSAAQSAGSAPDAKSSEAILNAELAVTLRGLNAHGPERTPLEGTGLAGLRGAWSSIDALTAALGAATPASQR